MTPSPRHLWSGDWRGESRRVRHAGAEARRARIAPSPPAAPRPATDGRARSARSRPAAPRAPTEHGTPASPGGRRSAGRRSRRAAAVALALAALATGAFLAGALIDGAGDEGDSAPAASGGQPAPLPGSRPPADVYAAASPAVVSVRAAGSEGSGFLIDQEGRIVTNAHVVGDSGIVTLRFGDDGPPLEGRVLGTDPSNDLAVVTIGPAGVPDGVDPLELADSRAVQVGDAAIAIGNPFGLDRTATAGIVSAVGRRIQAPNGVSIDSVVQTDAPINLGNSGGPLLDESARVIGVTSQIATAGSPGNVGVGFAVPSNMVREVVPRLIRGTP